MQIRPVPAPRKAPSEVSTVVSASNAEASAPRANADATEDVEPVTRKATLTNTDKKNASGEVSVAATSSIRKELSASQASKQHSKDRLSTSQATKQQAEDRLTAEDGDELLIGSTIIRKEVRRKDEDGELVRYFYVCRI